ncbi:capsule biosynthesis protein [Paraglaciecola chathamensis]|jgi:hypothetical protein|uniref:Capsule biosynthesis protein n=1 Tax=Paraglaciecola chathamensis TaxID=368405 RepID=A0ABS0WBY4_9ALTE|nr:capsule biosynthesis protein [Paraglaciecola chathamensis]MBJ2135950.1 capsule biosynthesis protein [Paraglaciecola chathamensis]
MLNKARALEAAAKRTQCDLADLNHYHYILVGGGAYVDELLRQLIEMKIRLPEYILVPEKMTLAVDIEQRIDDGISLINASHILLGTGSFQLEMVSRLVSRCEGNSVFLDVMQCAPKALRTLGSAQDYIVYVDLYSDINIPKYLVNFFKFLNLKGFRVDMFHPLEKLTDEYLRNAKGIIVWNGSLPAFVPVLSQAKKLSQKLTFAECGFFPQHQFFYLDKKGVNNQSQLQIDDLSWVGSEQFTALEMVRNSFDLAVAPYADSDYIFVPLQVPNDTNILNHSRFTSGMQAFIDFIEDKYSSEKIIFKAHPKDRMKSSYSLKHGVFSEDDSRSLIMSSKLVHGINTSVLYEAALLGKPVKIEGECLLKKHHNQINKLLAAICYRQFKVIDKRFDAAKLKQFSFLEPELLEHKLATRAKFKATTENNSQESENLE